MPASLMRSMPHDALPDQPPHEIEGGFFLYAALAANAAIALAKLVAAALSGSSAMLSEAFHSLVDTTNEVLLLHGRHRSRRPADADHPLGYAREIYFWSFIVSLLIFATGAAASAYEGVTHLIHPHEVDQVTVAYAVLAIAFVLEGSSWYFAHRKFAASAGAHGWYEAIRRSKNPPTFIVFLEDSAALIGILLAATGLSLSFVTGNPSFDGIASILIGCVLAAVAFLLAREAKHLLIGESAAPEVEAQLRAIAEAHAGKGAVAELLTLQIGPESVLAAIRIILASALQARAATLVASIHREAAAAIPQLTHLSVEPVLRCSRAEGTETLAPQRSRRAGSPRPGGSDHHSPAA